MKTLYLVRHAKSSWSDPTLDDFDRGLNKRGKRDLPVMADVLVKKDIEVDTIIVSPAKRTKKTGKAIARALDYETEDIVYLDRLYMCSEQTLFQALLEREPHEESIMIVAHNPALTELAETLGADIGNFPTCGVISFHIDIDDRQRLDPALVNFEWFEYPKMYV